MNSHEAKFILNAYRPSGRDHDDPLIQEALAQVDRDPDLRAWFEESRRFDLLISQKLQSSTIPTDLKANILAGKHIVRPQNPIWHRRPLLALVAAMSILLTLFALFYPVPKEDPVYSFAQGVISKINHEGFGLELLHPEEKVESHYLAARQAPRNYHIPARLQALSKIGCRVLEYDHNKVSLVCFNSEQGPSIHLLVVDRTSLPTTHSPLSPRFQRIGGWNTAIWSHDDHTFLLMSKGPEVQLAQYF